MTVEATPEGRSARPAIGSRLWDAPGAFYLLVFLFTVLSFAGSYFLTSANLTNIVLQASVILILALGVTLVIITKGIDLSLGPVLGFAGLVLALMLVGGFGFPLAMLAALLAAMAVGALNGYLVAFQNLQPFVVTLGTFGIASVSEWG